VDGPLSPWRGEQRWFDWIIVILSAWLVGGAFIDGWAHTHGKVDTTFFTPWHAAFYTGFLAVAGALVGALLHHMRRRGPWQRALPPGYNLSLLGVVIFACGGLGDLAWHTLFGIEKDVEALVHSQDDFVCFHRKPQKASNLRLAVKIACDRMNLTMY
jgi:hypothetical protein